MGRFPGEIRALERQGRSHSGHRVGHSEFWEKLEITHSHDRRRCEVYLAWIKGRGEHAQLEMTIRFVEELDIATPSQHF